MDEFVAVGDSQLILDLAFDAPEELVVAAFACALLPRGCDFAWVLFCKRWGRHVVRKPKNFNRRLAHVNSLTPAN